ncbi:MAG: Uma2 family endonuclease [Tannerella sp.]|jgi:Uma2 family endonuclease|nr:Uma2 family endonuclease [Tannerella sp.]
MKEYSFETEDRNIGVSEPPLTYQRRRYTYADYLGWADDVRRELIDGFIYALSAPLRKHAEITENLNFLMKLFMRKYRGKTGGKCKIYHAPFDVRLSPAGETADEKIHTVVQPDICVICDPSKLDERGCLGAPDLIVEVLSPSTAKRDLNEKFRLYEASGVREYWVVYPEDKALNVFILQEESGKYDEGAVYVKKGKVPVHIFEGLDIDLEELFAE